jgi:uncharacterized protein
MIVVSNTSPLTNLAAIGQFDLLHQLFGEILIPEGVWSELNAKGKRWPGSMEVENSTWTSRRSVQDQPLITALSRDLDRGESESIALAVELKADLVLLDEREARHAARRLGLSIMGVIGILLLAHSRHEIDHLKPHLDALRQKANFYINDQLYQMVLEQVRESSAL